MYICPWKGEEEILCKTYGIWNMSRLILINMELTTLFPSRACILQQKSVNHENYVVIMFVILVELASLMSSIQLTENFENFEIPCKSFLPRGSLNVCCSTCIFIALILELGLELYLLFHLLSCS